MIWGYRTFGAMNMKKQVVILFALCISLALMCVLSACAPAAPVPAGTTTLSPTASASPSNAAISRQNQTPDTEPYIQWDELALRPTRTSHSTFESYAQLDELASFGKGIMPNILRSQDGSKIFLSDDSSVRILNASDYSEITTITGPGDIFGYVYSISPDNSMMIINGIFGFRVVDIETQQTIANGSGGVGSTYGMVFTPNGKYVVFLRSEFIPSGTYDSICLVAIPKNNTNSANECYPTLEFFDNDVMTHPAVSPNSRMVAAGYANSSQNILYIWDLEEKTILHEIKDLPSHINSVAFSPDGYTLASVGDDGMIRLWNPATGKLKRSISGFTNDLMGVKFSEDSRQLIIKVHKQPSVILQLDSGKQVPATPESLDPLASQMVNDGYLLSGEGSILRFSPDGETLAVGHGSIQIWDVGSQSLKTALFTDKALNIAGMTFSSDGNHLAVVTVGGDVYAWDTRSGHQEFFVSANTLLDAQVLYAAGAGGIGPGIGAGVFGEQAVAFSPDASQLAIPNGPAVELWDIQTDTQILTLEQTEPVMFPSKITFSADGRFLYAALNRNRDLAVWNAETGKLIRQQNLPHVDPNAYSATEMYGQWFARNNYDDEDYWIEIWNVETGQMIKIPTHMREAEPLRISADGKFFAAILDNDQLFLWDVASGQLLFVSDKIFNLSFYSGEVFDDGDFVISPQGDLLATASQGQVTLWNLEPYTSLVSQPDFVPMAMPPTPTPRSSIVEHSTPAPQPTQVVTPLPVLPVSDDAIAKGNIKRIKLFGKIGKGKVNQVDWTEADQYILVTSSQGYYQLDPHSLEETKHFESGNLWVTSGRVLTDGRSLAAGYTVDDKVQIWDVEAQKLLVELTGGSQPALSPDGRWLVYINSKGLGTWDLEAGQPGISLLSSFSLSEPVFSPNSRFVAAVQSDRSVRVWDIETGVIVNGVGGPKGEFSDLSFSPDGEYLVGAAGGTAWVWSINPNRQPFKIKLFEGEFDHSFTHFKKLVTSAALNKNNSLLAIGTSERQILLYDRATGQLRSQLDGLASPPIKLVFSPDGTQLLSVDADGQVILWDVAQQKILKRSHYFSGNINGLVSRSDGDVSAWMNNTVWVIDQKEFEIDQTTYILTDKILAASPAGDLVAGYTPYQVSLYSAMSGSLSQTLPEEAADDYIEYYLEGNIIRQFYGALFSQDGKKLATFGAGGIWTYTYPDSKLISHLDEKITHRAAFSPDGDWLIASSHAKNWFPPVLIASETAEKIFSLDVGQDYSRGKDYPQYAVSPNKRLIGMLRRGWEDTSWLELVDTSTGQLAGKIEFMGTIPLSLAFNPSGTLVAVGDDSGSISLVDVAALRVVYTLPAHPGPVTSLVFSSDGENLVSAGSEGTVKIWGIP